MDLSIPGFDEPLLVLPEELINGESNFPANAGQRQLLLGIDGGATKTIAGLFDLATGSAWFGYSGPSNPRSVGFEQAGKAFQQSITDVLALAKVDPSEIRATVVSVSAFDSQDNRKQAFPYAPVTELLSSTYATNDLAAAWASGTYCTPGVAIICGTGCNTLGVGTTGQTWRVGGFDYVLGDEGSAFWIGLSAMKAVLRYRDSRGPSTALAERILSFFELQHVDDLVNLVLVENSSIGKSEVASFAPEVTKCAQEGDKVALKLIQDAAFLLAEQVNAAIMKLGLTEEFPVALVGGVWNAGEIIRAPFEQSVREVAPEARFVRPEIPPVGGAILLAAKAGNLFDSIDKGSFRDAMSEMQTSE